MTTARCINLNAYLFFVSFSCLLTMPILKNAALFLACLTLAPFAEVGAASCTADACVCLPASGSTCPSWMDGAYTESSDESVNGVTLCVRYNGGGIDMGGSFGSGADAIEGAIITAGGTTFTGPFDTCAETAPEAAPETLPEGSDDTSEATKTAAVMAMAAVVVGGSLIL